MAFTINPRNRARQRRRPLLRRLVWLSCARRMALRSRLRCPKKLTGTEAADGCFSRCGGRAWSLLARGRPMRTMPKALIVVVGMLLIELSAVPAQARFFVGFGLGYPEFYRPSPVFYRPYLPPPPPPPVYVAPQPAYYAPPPVIYR